MKHFWYSQRQQDRYSKRNRHECTAMIEGKEVLYTMASDAESHGSGWNDVVYLGSGHFFRIGGVIQNGETDEYHEPHKEYGCSGHALAAFPCTCSPCKEQQARLSEKRP